jgi:phosphoenolpyruvate synthase/pyruvate phosphate dikinase
VLSELAAGELSAREWGQKAARLSTAARAGLAVPPALCVQAAAVTGMTSAVAAWLGCHRPEQVVVRTSSAGEDTTEHAFAGRTLTRLGVPADPEAIHSVVLEDVLAAVDAPSPTGAVSGRGVSVIVQQQVRAELAGVAFSTAGGLTAEFSRVDTAAVTSGAAPQGWLERRDRTATAGGVLAPVMGLAESLTRTCTQLRSLFGFDVDVEWAWIAGAVIVLQVRPITADLGSRSAQRRATDAAPV